MSRVLAIVILIGVFGSHKAAAALLDWSNVTWTPESLSGVFDVDGDSVNDIQIEISDPTGALRNDYPDIQDSLQGGLPVADEALRLNVNFDSDSDTIVVTVTFLNDYAEATNVGLLWFDIDADRNGASSNYQYRDRLEAIYGASESGPVAATLVPGSQNSVSGSGTNQVVSGSDKANNNGKNSDEGTVSGNFGTNFISSFTFTFGNSPNIVGKGDPDAQQFAIYDIYFDARPKFPEVGTSVASAVCCLLGFAIARRLRAMRRE